jgi:hypothetical protein
MEFGDMPMRSEIQISVAEPRRRETWMDKAWQWTVATVENPEFLMVVLFCAVGLWMTFYFIHYFPDFGALQQMP